MSFHVTRIEHYTKIQAFMRIILLVIAMVWSYLSFAQEKPKGPVKSVYITSQNTDIDRSGNETVDRPVFVERSTYDKDGYLTRGEYGRGRDHGHLIDVYRYQGKLLMEKEFWDEEMKIGYRQVFEYRNGRVVVERWYTQGGKNDHKINYIYENDRLVRTEQFRGTKKYPSVTILYDERGREVETILFDENDGGSSFNVMRTVYDKKDRVVEETSYGDKSQNNKATYRYDDVCKRMKETHYKNGKWEKQKEYNYNDLGDLVREYERTNAPRILWQTTYSYVYSTEGTVLKKIENHHNETNGQRHTQKITTSYMDFDRYGNYLQAVMISEDDSGKDMITTTRWIKYYEQ